MNAYAVVSRSSPSAQCVRRLAVREEQPYGSFLVAGKRLLPGDNECCSTPVVGVETLMFAATPSSPVDMLVTVLTLITGCMRRCVPLPSVKSSNPPPFLRRVRTAVQFMSFITTGSPL